MSSAAPTLILASRSPRRALLLREAGFVIEQVDPPFDDPPEPATHDTITAAQWAMDLALNKARSVIGARATVGNKNDGALVLGADTIVVAPDGRWLGQPQSRAAAEAMLRSYLGRQQQVVTGVALVSADHEESFADTATVNFDHVSEPMLRAYLDSRDWRSKAGGYNLFELIDRGWPIRYEGDPGTIVGLPMRRLVPLLRGRGVLGHT